MELSKCHRIGATFLLSSMVFRMSPHIITLKNALSYKLKWQNVYVKNHIFNGN